MYNAGFQTPQSSSQKQWLRPQAFPATLTPLTIRIEYLLSLLRSNRSRDHSKRALQSTSKKNWLTSPILKKSRLFCRPNLTGISLQPPTYGPLALKPLERMHSSMTHWLPAPTRPPSVDQSRASSKGFAGAPKKVPYAMSPWGTSSLESSMPLFLSCQANARLARWSPLREEPSILPSSLLIRGWWSQSTTPKYTAQLKRAFRQSSQSSPSVEAQFKMMFPR